MAWHHYVQRHLQGQWGLSSSHICISDSVDSVSNHQPHDCLLNCLFRRRSKKTSKLRVTGLCAGNSPGTGEFPAQMARNAENISIWWRHHDILKGWYKNFHWHVTCCPLKIHMPSVIWVKSQKWGCLVTWFCYQLIAKPGNKITTPLWLDLYEMRMYSSIQVGWQVPLWVVVDMWYLDGSSNPRNDSLAMRMSSSLW